MQAYTIIKKITYSTADSIVKLPTNIVCCLFMLALCVLGLGLVYDCSSGCVVVEK